MLFPTERRNINGRPSNTTRLDRVFVDARAKTWQHVASMENRCRQCLPPQGDPRALACSPTYDLGDLGILYEFWERSTVLLNLRINKDLELVLIHFLGVKNVRHLPCGFEFSGFKFPESSIYVYGGKQKILSFGSNSKGCVRGLKFLKGLF